MDLVSIKLILKFHLVIKAPLFGICLFLVACSSMEKSEQDKIKEKNLKGEYIYRISDKYVFHTPAPCFHIKEKYPWERSFVGIQPRINKEFFRCNGSALNPPRLNQEESGVCRQYDCGGAQKHSLPLRNEKEFVFPALIELLNFVQAKTGKKVVITSAYRCPEHNNYVDQSPSNRYSKHMIGAEVDFYVLGMESQPESIVNILMQYYQEVAPFRGQKEFEEFERYEKDDTNVSTKPWFNKEIFIKLFRNNEGRNFDNRHPYPYISIQIRYDRDRKERVNFNMDQALKNYLRK